MSLKKITKRDGRVVPFESTKIESVISKAGIATGEYGTAEVKRLTTAVVKELRERFSGTDFPHVEDVQNTVEYVLVREDHYKTAKAFILYREEHRKAREAREALGVKDDLGLSLNTLKVLEKRYLLHDQNNRVIETPSQMFKRVANFVANAEKRYKRGKNGNKNVEKFSQEFYDEMAAMRFLPGGRVLSNAGTKTTCLSSCFVLPVDDSIEGIFDSVKWGAIIHKTGGGTGYNFSSLRPSGDYVSKSRGFASGPISFMTVFDTMCQTISLGGRQRGAMMGMLNVDHPDIIDFITAKRNGTLKNFNLSVGATDAFMKAVERDREFSLISLKTKEKVHTVKARELLNLIASNAWQRGDPGIVFLDALQRGNSLKKYEVINSVNVCGEIPLPPFDACNLGAINLEKFVTEKREVDWIKLENSVKVAVRFMDNIISVNKLPLRQLVKTVSDRRRIGLGLMGFAEMLFLLRIPYASKAGVQFADRLMKFIKTTAFEASSTLANERGNFPLWDKSEFAHRKKPMRNCALLTVAPTGTISMIPEVTGGIEPVFGLAFTKHVVQETGLFYINKIFEKTSKEEGFYSQALIEEVARKGSLQGTTAPKWAKEVFVTAHDIQPEWHVRMQAVFQKHVDNSVSKTINLPNRATVQDIKKMYLLAWKLGCKGITVYRDRSLEEQVLTHGKDDSSAQSLQTQTTQQVTPLSKRKFSI